MEQINWEVVISSVVAFCTISYLVITLTISKAISPIKTGMDYVKEKLQEIVTIGKEQASKIDSNAKEIITIKKDISELEEDINNAHNHLRNNDKEISAIKEEITKIKTTCELRNDNC